MKGTVKRFDDERGYGALDPDDEGESYVRFTAIATNGYKTLRSDTRGEFEIDETATKYCAVKVCPESPTSKPPPERLA